MRRHRLVICLLALSAATLFAQMPLLGAVIGTSFCTWVVAAALLPAPADETTTTPIGDHRE